MTSAKCGIDLSLFRFHSQFSFIPVHSYRFPSSSHPFSCQALTILSILLSSSSKDISSVAQFPPLWAQAHQDWNIVTLLVSIVKTAEIDPDDLLATDGSSVTQQFVEALLGLLNTVVQFVSDRIRFVSFSEILKKICFISPYAK